MTGKTFNTLLSSRCMLKQIILLVKKDLLLEWRQKYAFNGVLLYMLSTIFVIYISILEVAPFLWIALFWIIMLFASVNTIAKSFIAEGRFRLLYYYTLSSPQSFIISKMIYNSALMLLLAVTGLIFYSIIIGNPIQHTGYFLIAVVSGSINFSLTLTMMSAIAAKANNNSTLMAILSFPIIIPALLLLIKLSMSSIFASTDEFPLRDLLILLSLDCVILAMALILFPYLWKD